MKLVELQERAANPKTNRIISMSPAEITDMVLDDVQAASPFADLKLAPDQTKSYIYFKILKTSPSVHGPSSSGNYNTYHPGPVSRSHHTLFHQQLNLNHQIKAYHPGNKSARDRIVGAIVGTAFPDPGMGGWEMAATAEAAPSIEAVACLWKLAEGAKKVLGEHLSGRPRWSVSIEVTAEIADMGIFIPSARKIFPLFEAPEEVLEQAVKPDGKGGIDLGTFEGEQLVWAYGHTTGKMHFPGTGMTTNPAETTAQIHRVLASRSPGVDMVGDELSLGAEMQSAMVGEAPSSSESAEESEEGSAPVDTRQKWSRCTAMQESASEFKGALVKVLGSPAVARVIDVITDAQNSLVVVPNVGVFPVSAEYPLLRVSCSNGVVYKRAKDVRLLRCGE